MTTRKDVAQLAGVSEATVSRVFNQVGPMREETRLKVLEAARRLNYHPSALARNFARRRSGNLGVVVPYLPKVHLFSTYYFSEILSGIGESAQASGYHLLLLFRNPRIEMDYAELFLSQKVDGCIILGSRDVPEEKKALHKAVEAGLPVCLVNQHFEELDCSEVDADHVDGSYRMVQHLIERGYKRIAFLNGPEEFSNSRDRLQGYYKALQEAGLPVERKLLFQGNYSRKSGYEAAARIAAGPVVPEAVFAANDRMAIGLVHGFREQGMAVGRDIAVAGYDDSDGSRLIDPPLTTVHVPFFEMGRLAGQKVLETLAEGNGRTFRLQLPARLVIRQST